MSTGTLKACLLAGALALVALPSIAAAQTAPARSSSWKAPRTAFGQPDIQGYWTNSTLTPAERPQRYGDRLVLTDAERAEIEDRNNALIAAGNEPTPVTATVAEISAKANCSGNRGTNCNYDAGWTAPGDSVMRVNGQPRSSLITTPDGRVPPRITGARATVNNAEGGEGDDEVARNRAQPNRNDNPETRGLAERCIISFGRSGGPPMFDQLYNSTYQFAQSKDSVAIWVEMVHDVRVIRLNSKHRTDGVRPYFGDSIGWWDGDTLVVETTNIPRSQAYNGSWENLKVIEKFTRTPDDRLNYKFEIHDPTMWDKPWGGEYEFARSEPVYEYACHEGNYGLQNILAGARAEEQEAAAQTASTSAR